ncbi:hypothetical protein [Mucilaginibacter agri]|uniref:Uncharacterized protein n=1 Tax=Mucilaginibacter agri TaxID=2695265 RepID=A0A965ZFI1_9SPHI|nr:hypothetical protein [Mucilaginibacter agri]NCD69162.1 hypothetical protein [Mucilaginibacter agri]
MKRPIINALAFSLLLILCINQSFAQKASLDSNANSFVESYVVNYYNKSVGQQSRLYNGAEYTPYSPVIKNNPYFQDLTDVKPGTVTFDGYTYTKVPMMYDMYKDVLAVQLYNNFTKYVLASERVGSFDLSGHHFVYVSADTVVNAGSFASGFYEQMYGGKTEALARYSKSIQNQSSGNDIETYFTKVKTLYYIKKGGSYHEVSSEGDVLKLLKDRKKELQQYIKTNNINFRKAPVEALTSVAGYYDRINS